VPWRCGGGDDDDGDMGCMEGAFGALWAYTCNYFSTFGSFPAGSEAEGGPGLGPPPNLTSGLGIERIWVEFRQLGGGGGLR